MKSLSIKNSLFFAMLTAGLYLQLIPFSKANDCILVPGQSGYAILDGIEVADLDYTRNFSVEVLYRWDANQNASRGGTVIRKHLDPFYNGTAGWALQYGIGDERNYYSTPSFSICDGATTLDCSPGSYQGMIYCAATFNAATKTLTVYLNDKPSKSVTAAALVPANIK